MIDLINDEFGTNYEDETSWEQVLLPSTLPRSPAQAGLPVGERRQHLPAGLQSCWAVARLAVRRAAALARPKPSRLPVGEWSLGGAACSHEVLVMG